MTKTILLATSLAFALPGCVAKKKYDQLQAESTLARDAYASDLGMREAREKVLADELAAQQAAIEAELRTTKEALAAKERTLAERDRSLASKEALLEEMRAKNATALKDRGALKAEVDDMKAALRELEERRASADARLQEFRDLLGRFKSLIDAGTLQVKIKEGRMLVAMATDVLFASGSATLSKDGEAALGEVAGILSSIPDRTFQVEGHTDDDPIRTATFPSNWHLASRRSLNVVKHMLDNGMSPERISAASFGEFRPVAPNEAPEGKALNRRIEIIVVPDLSQLPGYDELQALK